MLYYNTVILKDQGLAEYVQKENKYMQMHNAKLQIEAASVM